MPVPVPHVGGNDRDEDHALRNVQRLPYRCLFSEGEERITKHRRDKAGSAYACNPQAIGNASVGFSVMFVLHHTMRELY